MLLFDLDTTFHILSRPFESSWVAFQFSKVFLAFVGTRPLDRAVVLDKHRPFSSGHMLTTEEAITN
jgi:hypothetical protein